MPPEAIADQETIARADFRFRLRLLGSLTLHQLGQLAGDLMFSSRLATRIEFVPDDPTARPNIGRDKIVAGGARWSRFFWAEIRDGRLIGESPLEATRTGEGRRDQLQCSVHLTDALAWLEEHGAERLNDADFARLVDGDFGRWARGEFLG